jgi:hypothetical protein
VLECGRLSSFIIGCLGIVLAVFKGFYSLDYGKFTPYLMGAIHELTERVVRLESENAMQETIRTQIGEVLARLTAAGL